MNDSATRLKSEAEYRSLTAFDNLVGNALVANHNDTLENRRYVLADVFGELCQKERESSALEEIDVAASEFTIDTLVFTWASALPKYEFGHPEALYVKTRMRWSPVRSLAHLGHLIKSQQVKIGKPETSEGTL